MILFNQNLNIIGAQLLIEQYNQIKMDIQQSQDEIINQLTSLSLNTECQQPQKRESNTLIAAQMPFQINPSHIEQYNKLYLSRLAQLSKRISLNKLYKIQAVEEKLGVINIVGIFKRIQCKRVRAFQKQYQQYYSEIKQIYNEKDTLQLQDSTGKLKFILTGNTTMNGKLIRPTDLPHGVILGLTGKNNDEKMQFMVQKITLPNLPPQKPFIFQQYSQPRKTLIISSPTVQQIHNVLHQICSVGNLPVYNIIKSIIIVGFDQKLSASDCRRLDELFQVYADSIDIFIMPNQKQGQIYPQRPIHPILFSKSYKKISLVNNPQVFYPNVEDEQPNSMNTQKLSGSILVCSGQNIQDLIKNCSFGNTRLDILQSLIQYSHLAPTSPFSLKCSMMPQDFLVMNQLPHILLAGQCDQTMARDYHFENGQGKGKVKLITLKSRESVLVDIDNHQVQMFEICSAGVVDYDLY